MIFNMDKWFTKSNYGTRSLQGDSSYSSVNTIVPPKLSIDNSRLALMQLNIGIAYACSQKISNFLSAIPLHIYAEVPEDSELLTPHKSLSKKELKGFRTVTKNIQITTKGIHKVSTGTKIVELKEHPLIDLIHRPNEYMAWSDWMNICETYLSILGNAYFRIERKGKQIIGLYPLLGEYVWTYTDLDGTILRYEYYPSSQEYKSKIYQPDEILHFKTPSAGSIQSGRGWMESVQKEIRLLDEANNHQISLAGNMGQPGAIVTIHGKVGDKAQVEKIKSEFSQKWGKLNRGLPFVSFSQNENDKIEVTPYGQSIKDMAYTENQPFLRSVICAASGVPIDLITNENSSRATSQTAMQSFLSFTILPRINGLVEVLNHQIVPEFDENVFIGYDNNEVIEADPVIQSQVLKTYMDAGIMTNAECREILGLEPLPEEEIKPPKQGSDSNFSSNNEISKDKTDEKHDERM